LSPSLSAAHQQLGEILLAAGDERAAIPYLEEASRLNPEIAETHCDLSDAYRKDGRAAEADRELQVCRASKTLSPQAPPPEQKDLHP
jgi:Flp pilus assembly protein TadD